MQNSWLVNNPRFRQGKHAYNPLYMNEADAARRGLYEGDEVRVFNSHGSIEAWLTIDNNLRVGTVAMTHGYGQQNSFGLQVAQRKPGSNCNALMPTGPEAVEPISYMSWLSAVPVEVKSLHK
jgi:anaerobic selenocysteine-containing dehydrogenase